MNLFSALPEDIQREICYFLSKKELTKLSSKILQRQDVFWKEKLRRTYCCDLKYLDYEILYERLYYQNLLKDGWNNNLALNLIDDEDFLKNHINLTEGPSVPGRTLLYYICQLRSVENEEEREKAIRKLVSMGANVNSSDCDGGSVLSVAFKNQKISIIKFLLDSGANVNRVNNFRRSVLCDAISNKNIEKIKLLLDYGADVNYSNIHVENPLVSAVYLNKIEKVKLLLDYGPSAIILQRALRAAENRGYVDIADLIRSKM